MCPARSFCHLLLLVLLLTPSLVGHPGCATTNATINYRAEEMREFKVAKSDRISVVVEPAQEIEMLGFEKERMGAAVSRALKERMAQQPAGTESREYKILVTVTRYEKGNAFARSMLPGLGQVRLEGNVVVTVPDQEKPLAEFSAYKQMALGGIYGAVSGIEQVEIGFAEGIAEALTGIS